MLFLYIFGSILILLIGFYIIWVINVPTVLSYPIQETKEYKESNTYKQDFLFYCALLEDTHPNQDFFKSEDWRKAKMFCASTVDTCNNVDDFAVAIQHLSASLQDAHTSFLNQFLYYDLNNKNIKFNFLLQWISDSLRIVETCNSQKHLLGKTIKTINGISLDTLIHRTGELIGCENKAQKQNKFVRIIHLGNIKLLSQLGLIIPNEQIVINDTIVIEQKGKEDLVYFVNEPNSITLKSNQSIKTHIDSNIAYLQLNDMAMNPEYAKKEFDNFFNDVAKSNSQHLVIDLRNNGGGNSRIGDMLLEKIRIKKNDNINNGSVTAKNSRLFRYYFKIPNMMPRFLLNINISIKIGREEEEKEKFKGKVYFLQGRNTFSAATDLALFVHDNNLFTTIGEPSSQKPCSYGDILFFELPNTKLHGGVSYKYFTRPDKSKCDEDYLYPNVNIPYTFEDFKNGIDPCWEWVLKDIEKHK